MTAILPGIIASSVASYAAVPINFNGAAYLSRGSALSGAVDGKLGVVSFWFRPTTAAADQTIINAAGGNFTARCNTTTRTILLFATSVLQVTTVGAVALNQWNHVACGWNMASQPTLKGYINRTSTTFTVTTYTDANLNWDSAAWSVGRDQGAATRFINNGDLADVILYTDQYIDVETDLNNFITPGGRPVDPDTIAGIYGAPSLGFAGPLSTWQDNLKGDGGTFTENDTLGAGTSPVALP